MKFAVQIRLNHASKPGGDTALAKAFVNRLRSSGHQAELVTDIAALQALRPDALLAFNLDQPLELLALCKTAHALGCRIAVYPLHHPACGVAAYLSSELRGLRGLVARLVQRDPARYFHLMAMLRGTLRRDVLALDYFWRPRTRLLADIAALVEDLLVSGPSEAAELRARMPVFKNVPVYLVPHPIDLDPLPELDLHPRSDRQGRVFLTAGRIESRKNALAVLAVAAQFPADRFTFAGAINESDQSYAAAFKKALRSAPNCEWVGQLDMPGLLSAIANADAVLSPSWFEVMSLINLFAHALGTPVISSIHTYDTDLLGAEVRRFVPEKGGDLARVLLAWHGSAQPKASIGELRCRASAFTAQTWAGFDQWVARLSTTSRGFRQ